MVFIAMEFSRLSPLLAAREALFEQVKIWKKWKPQFPLAAGLVFILTPIAWDKLAPDDLTAPVD